MASKGMVSGSSSQHDAQFDSDSQIHGQIAIGREALSRAHPRERVRDRPAVSRLFTLLWHPDDAIRRAAALALPGGDATRAYEPQYGHFATSFLRYLMAHSPHGRQPISAAARHSVVVAALRSMLEQSNNDIRAMSNMNYSFLSNALYLALLSTCRDVTESVRRVCDGALHPEVIRLLCSLGQVRVVRKLNARDAEALTNLAGQALAAMPPDEISEFWRCLTHQMRARRRAVAPTLQHLQDREAVPHLLNALPGQPAEIAQPLISCLGRLGDASALPILVSLTRSRHRGLRVEAQNAVQAIRRANATHPSRILLRPARTEREDALLLRSLGAESGFGPPDQLLRPTLKADEDV